MVGLNSFTLLPVHIASRYYEREIAAYDIKTLRCDVYGEGSGYRERSMLIYDGLHYDALAIAAFENAPEDVDVSVFDSNGPQGGPAHQGALAIAKQVSLRFFNAGTICCLVQAGMVVTLLLRSV